MTNINLNFVAVIILTAQMSKKKILEGILRIRKEKGLKQADLAEKLGISRSMYSQLENGSQQISLERLEEILNALQTDIIELLKITIDTEEIDGIITKHEEVIEMLKKLREKKEE